MVTASLSFDRCLVHCMWYVVWCDFTCRYLCKQIQLPLKPKYTYRFLEELSTNSWLLSTVSLLYGMKTSMDLGDSASSCHRLQMTSNNSFLISGICNKHSSQPLKCSDSMAKSRCHLSVILISSNFWYPR